MLTHQIHGRNKVFLAERATPRSCHLRELQHSCDVPGMDQKVSRSEMCGSFIGDFPIKPPFTGDFPASHVWWNQRVKHFMRHCKILSYVHLRMNLSGPGTCVKNSDVPSSTAGLCTWKSSHEPLQVLGTQPFVKISKFGNCGSSSSRVGLQYLPSRRVSGPGEISSIRCITITPFSLATMSPPCSSPDGLTEISTNAISHPKSGPIISCKNSFSWAQWCEKVFSNLHCWFIQNILN